MSYPDKLARYLQQHAIAAILVHPDAETPTVPAAAAALHCATEQIIKSVLFILKEGEQASARLVISNGVAPVDFHKLAGLWQVSRKRIRLAPAEVVLAETGYPAGGVPPFGFAQPIPTFIDQRVLAQPVIFGGGGDHRTMLRLTPEELMRVTRGQIADVRQTAPDLDEE
ncbi:MAG: YbaK/EbsC family protein [Anaerolineae bacterium]